MMSIWHLLWIVPCSAFAGVMLAALLRANDGRG